VSDIPFYRTRMGQVFIETTVPELVNALLVVGRNLKRLADWLEKRESEERTLSERSNDGVAR
jgi:hypothetical protein